MAEQLRIDAEVRERGVQLDLALAPGRVTALVGPNGAGKSTLVQLVDGGVRPSRGTVELGGRVLSGPSRHVPTHRRPIALLQQHPVLFPHLDVLDNVAFGPRSKGSGRAAAHDRARAELEAVGCAELAQRSVRGLSGGQAQRVALARALATDPAVLLLDEPFAALDVNAAASMRRLLSRRLAVSQPPTMVLVTHDPLDVWALASAMVCLQDGQVSAAGAVEDLLGRPRTSFLAELSGINLVRGQVREDRLMVGQLSVHGLWDGPAGRQGDEAMAWFEPSAVALHRQSPGGSPRNAWPVRVTALEPRGATVRVRLDLDDGQPLAADLTAQAVAALGLAPDDRLVAQVKATQVRMQQAWLSA
ncbi:sulfate/molybdate ABC transporter ATP-binding protein [Luteococcus sp. OSA5]|uniref:sulfate/molybdate ABC transporter ATP-binding protein n=1 Tax=Luteococcus sp. OSA5 TaxID=3401630 RepID=UPI003B42A5B2